MTAPLSVPLVVNNVVQPAAYWPGGTGILVGVGTWSSGVYTLNYLGPDGSTYISLTPSLNANGVSASFTLPAGYIKVVLSGGTTTGAYVNAAIIPTNLN